MKKVHLAGLLSLSLLALVACGEKPQTIGSNSHHVPAFQGTHNGFVAPGWKAGDKTSWEQGLKTRAMNSQNEYTKTTR